MQVIPYLFFNGNCEAAFKFYEKALGAKIEVMLTHRGSAAGHADAAGTEEEDHARQDFDRRRGVDGVRRAAGHFNKPQGFSVCLTVEDPADAERKFKALSEGGTVNMPFGKTFFSKGSACASTSSASPGWSTARWKDESRVVRPGRSAATRIDRRQFASAQQQQPRRQSAAADDPAAHAGRIGLAAPARTLPVPHTIRPRRSIDRAA